MFIRYAFLADSITLDAAGKLSAIGIFDHIYATQFPARHRDMVLVANIEGSIAERGEHKISVELRDNDGNRLTTFEQKIDFKNPTSSQENLRAGLILQLQDLVFPRAGQYEFVIFGDDRFLGRVLFSIYQIRVKSAGEA